MRFAFFSLCLLGLSLTVYALGFSSSPPIENVQTFQLDEWFVDGALWAGLVGVFIGGLGSMMAVKNQQHVPHESGSQFHSRVAGRGVWALIVAALLGTALGFLLATSAAWVPLAPLDRGLTLLWSGKGLAFPGASVLACGVVFIAVTRVQRWGGRYALDLMPKGEK